MTRKRKEELGEAEDQKRDQERYVCINEKRNTLSEVEIKSQKKKEEAGRTTPAPYFVSTEMRAHGLGCEQSRARTKQLRPGEPTGKPALTQSTPRTQDGFQRAKF